MKPIVRKALTIIVTSLLLQACGSNPMKVALTEMGTSSAVEYGAYDYRHIRSINITGLSPEESIGSLTIDADKKSLPRFGNYLYNIFVNNDLPDMMNARVRTGPSLIQVSTACKIKDTCLTPLEAVQLKENIEKREIILGTIATAEVDIKAIQLTKIALDSKSKPEDKEPLLTAIKQKYLENSTIKDATVTTYATSFATTESALRKTISDAKAELDSLMKAINKPGVIVSNWKLEKSASASGSAPGASGVFSSNRDKYGYVIFINPTQFTLEIGNDIGEILSDMSSQSHMKNIVIQNRMYITTYQMRVSELIYSESLESIIGANIDVKIDELAKTLQPLLGAGISIDSLTGLKAQVAAEYKRYSFSSNQGVLSFRNEGDPIQNPKSYKLKDILATTDQSSVVEPLKSYFSTLYQTRAVINQRISFDQYLDTFNTTDVPKVTPPTNNASANNMDSKPADKQGKEKTAQGSITKPYTTDKK